MTDEIVLPLRVVPQPVPFLNTGGDCVSCCLSGVLQTKPEAVYEQLADLCGAKSGKPERSFNWISLRQALWDLQGMGQLSDVITDTPYWFARGSEEFYGLPGFMCSGPWYRYVRMALQAGYYVFANVSMGQDAPRTYPDHCVLIVGAGTQWEEIPGIGRRGTESILVSCSSTRTPDEEWISAHKFLSTRGGYNVYLARPK